MKHALGAQQPPPHMSPHHRPSHFTGLFGCSISRLIFSHRTIFFSHNKSATTVKQRLFSAKANRFHDATHIGAKALHNK